MTPKRIVLVVLVVSVVAFVVRQGIVHHWRLKPTTGLQNCRTHEPIDDGCSMLGACLMCGYACAPGTEPSPLARADCR